MLLPPRADEAIKCIGSSIGGLMQGEQQALHLPQKRALRLHVRAGKDMQAQQ